MSHPLHNSMFYGNLAQTKFITLWMECSVQIILWKTTTCLKGRSTTSKRHTSLHNEWHGQMFGDDMYTRDTVSKCSIYTDSSNQVVMLTLNLLHVCLNVRQVSDYRMSKNSSVGLLIWYTFMLENISSLQLSWIGCLTSQLTIFQSYMWRHIDVQADWRRSWTYGRAPNAIDIS